MTNDKSIEGRRSQWHRPCEGRRFPSGRDGVSNVVAEEERIAVDVQIEEGDEVAVKRQRFGLRHLRRPRRAVESERRVEKTRRNFPRQTVPLVEQLAHLSNKSTHQKVIPLHLSFPLQIS